MNTKPVWIVIERFLGDIQRVDAYSDTYKATLARIRRSDKLHNAGFLKDTTFDERKCFIDRNKGE